MAYVFKISKKGRDVLGKDDHKLPTKDASGKPIPSLFYTIALPYHLGANAQLDRYKEATKLLTEETSGIGTATCLYEASSLFENLATVAKYMKLCEHEHESNSLYINIRNHIRHDIRENFENENHSQKLTRAKKLGINEAMETEMTFSGDAIRISTTVIELRAIGGYLTWTGKIITDAMDDAHQRGYLR